MTRPRSDYYAQEDDIQSIAEAASPDDLSLLLASYAPLGGDGKVPTENMHSLLATYVSSSTSYGRSLTQMSEAASVITSLNTARSYFRAYKGSGQSGIVDNTTTKVTFETEVLDVGSHYDNATDHRWTPPAGPVIIGSRALFSGTTAAGSFNFLAIYKNGLTYARTYSQVANTGTITVIAFDVASGTDYYEVFANVDTTGGTWGISGAGSDTTNFWGIQL